MIDGCMSHPFRKKNIFFLILRHSTMVWSSIILWWKTDIPPETAKTDCRDESRQGILTGWAGQRRISAGQVQENPG